MLKFTTDITGECDLQFAEANHHLEGQCRIVTHGTGNRIMIGAQTRLAKVSLVLNGDNHEVVIGDQNEIGHLDIRANMADSRIAIGSANRIRGLLIANGEGHADITIGHRCLVSTDVVVKTHDSHPIYSLDTNERINRPRGIVIRDKVWLSEEVWVFKGAEIDHDTVIGGRAIVTGAIPANVIAAGTPARVVKTDTRWIFKEKSPD